ncbi:MAG: hypothetical protein LBU81_05220 [Methanosarcinales archaeon]|nr:hypothetical protein [Methanosarcinales archaeon]
MLERYSDLIVYVTIKEIKPSVWDTDDSKIPQEVQNQLDAGGLLWSSDYEIYTDMIVTVDDYAKGNSSEEITIRLFGGQVDNIVQYSETLQNPWDFDTDDQYLLYLTNYRFYSSNPYQLTQGESVRVVVN